MIAIGCVSRYRDRELYGFNVNQALEEGQSRFPNSVHIGCYLNGEIGIDRLGRSIFGSLSLSELLIADYTPRFYNDFFAKHPVTHFCQISVLKAVIACPYSEPLALLMAKNYALGNLNASLFATEGIASVGPTLAPLACAFPPSPAAGSTD